MNNNLFLRILSSLVLAPLCFYIIYKGSFYFICFLLICLGIITTEVKKLVYSKIHFLINKVSKNYGTRFNQDSRNITDKDISLLDEINFHRS